MQVSDTKLSRRDRERLARRQAMLSAASEAFAEKGFAKATIEEIAHRAEFGKGTLYNYFPGGKQEILFAIFDQLYDQLRGVISRNFSSPRSAERSFEQSLERFFAECFEFFLDRLSLFFVLIREAHRLGFSDEPDAKSFFNDQREKTLRALADPIEMAIRNGELRPMNPRLLANLILTNVKGCQMQHCFESGSASGCDPAESTKTAEEMAETLTKILMHGAARPKS